MLLLKLGEIQDDIAVSPLLKLALSTDGHRTQALRRLAQYQSSSAGEAMFEYLKDV